MLNPYLIIGLLAAAILLAAFYIIARVHMKQALVSAGDDWITAYLKSVQKKLGVAGGVMKESTYLTILLVSPLVLCGLGLLMGNVPFAFVLMGCGFFLPNVALSFVEHQARKKFEERYARALDQMSASLRAGFSIEKAVNAVVTCEFVHPSMRRRYARLSADLQMGIPVAAAFHRFAEGTDSQDAYDVALAIDVQNEVGGHEADVVASIANNIKTRIQLRKEVSSIFASTSSMVYVMDFMSYAVMLGFMALSWSYVRVFFTTPTYLIIFAACMILPGAGSVINHRQLRHVRKGA